MIQRMCSPFARLLVCVVAMTGSSSAFASGVEVINYYQILLEGMGFESHGIHPWLATVGALVSLVVLTAIGLRYRGVVEADIDRATIPPATFSVRAVVEMILEFVYDLAYGMIGNKHGGSFFPLLAGLFCFIFVSNLSGLVPGFFPATDSLNTNLAMGLVVFFAYNIAGIREHGTHYIKQFTGPALWLAPLMLVIEVIGHMARPLSLSLRLYGNIFGDHLVLSVFTGLTVLVFPAALLFFGLLVASLQSFVFTLLTGIYVAMAVSHDH